MFWVQLEQVPTAELAFGVQASAGAGAAAKVAPVLPRSPFQPSCPGHKALPKGFALDSRQALSPQGRVGLELGLEEQGWDNSPKGRSNCSDCGTARGRSRTKSQARMLLAAQLKYTIVCSPARLEVRAYSPACDISKLMMEIGIGVRPCLLLGPPSEPALALCPSLYI